jgi:hypothetical protein
VVKAIFTANLVKTSHVRVLYLLINLNFTSQLKVVADPVADPVAEQV